MNLGDICKCLGHENASTEKATGFATDSRAVKPGNIFVCIKGEKVDGHDYAKNAEENGALAIIAERPVEGVTCPVLLVPGTVRALARLAIWRRSQTRAKVICITGTAGKTTLKQTLAAIFSEAGKTACSEGNHNTQIGMPISILETEGDEKFWILEAGISHEGDMDELGAIASPDLALILNVGKGHTEGLGNKGVAWHKTRLLTHLRPGGKALASADYPDLLNEARALGADLVLFSARGDEVARFATLEGKDGKYRLRLNGEICEFETPFFGEYGAETAIAAAACATLCGIDGAAIQKGFNSVNLPPQRFSRKQVGNWTVFDDTYNANPLSMRRMLEASASWARERRLPFVAVLGQMGELGKDAEACHRELGETLAKLAPAAVFWKGDHAGEIQEGMGGHGEPWAAFHHVNSGDEFAREWNSFIREREDRGVIIFKGSRSNRMEDLLSVFTNPRDGK